MNEAVFRKVVIHAGIVVAVFCIVAGAYYYGNNTGRRELTVELIEARESAEYAGTVAEELRSNINGAGERVESILEGLARDTAAIKQYADRAARIAKLAEINRVAVQELSRVYGDLRAKSASRNKQGAGDNNQPK